MKLFRTPGGVVVEDNDRFFLSPLSWDEILGKPSLHAFLESWVQQQPPSESARKLIEKCLAPIGSQEVWAAGVTYMRSKEARMEESQRSGAAVFYDKVYDAERPEVFFKSLPHRVAGPGDAVHIRKDSTWNVPEPELTLVIDAKGSVIGYTIGNDMSSRSIEGENPLYLPQAKTYDRSAALGPCVLITKQPISPETQIHMVIRRNGAVCYDDRVAISRMKRKHDELAGYLYREMSFPMGCYLMTGTCLVPPNNFTLAVGDVVEIAIDGIGLLTNTVAIR